MRGFIVQPTYRVERQRPVIHLFGRLETGESFLVRDTRETPYFFIHARDGQQAGRFGATRQSPTNLRTMRGETVIRIEVATPSDARPLCSALQKRGIPVFEGDLGFANRYLIDRGIRGSLSIEGGETGEAPIREQHVGGRFRGRCFENPDVAGSDWSPGPELLRVVSLDLETDPRGIHVLSAALAGAGCDEVLVATSHSRVAAAVREAPADYRITACGDERRLIEVLFERLRRSDFDVLTGWNVIDFDLSVLVAAAERLRVPFELGRIPGSVSVVRDRAYRGRSRAAIPGRIVLDGIDLLKGAFVKLPDYRLDTAAREILGAGKVVLDGASGGAPAGKGRAAAIQTAFREDLARFIDYNMTDARLVLGIFDRAQLLDLAIRRSRMTGMPLDRVGASIASFDSLYLHRLRRRGRVAPSVGDAGDAVEPTAGGAVLEPSPGLHQQVLALDFKSLYPSLIRTFNIDPAGHATGRLPEESVELIRAPNGAMFLREPGILPGLLAELFPLREVAKRDGDRTGSQALKILMNSFYGVLATPACRFYSSPVANAITSFGQWALHWTRDLVHSWGHEVLYGDTDSLFVASGRNDRRAAWSLGEELCARANEALRRQIRKTWRVESCLELQFEALYLKLFLPALRHGKSGARKRYAGLIAEGADAGSGERAIFVGMEVVRRDWTEVSKIFQRGLFERLFRGCSPDAVADYLCEFVRDLRAGRHDANLVYRKALRKELSEYTATTPPHVRAARKLGAPAGRLIEYVMTTAGPEPAVARAGEIDYAHYVDRQIRPIAEQVLPYLGIAFDDILDDRAQGRLF